MAGVYFTFPALLVTYVAQRAVDLRAQLGRPRFAILPKLLRPGALRAASHPA
jgi:hypothetical protein